MRRPPSRKKEERRGDGEEGRGEGRADREGDRAELHDDASATTVPRRALGGRAGEDHGDADDADAVYLDANLVEEDDDLAESSHDANAGNNDVHDVHDEHRAAAAALPVSSIKPSVRTPKPAPLLFYPAAGRRAVRVSCRDPAAAGAVHGAPCLCTELAFMPCLLPCLHAHTS